MNCQDPSWIILGRKVDLLWGGVGGDSLVFKKIIGWFFESAKWKERGGKEMTWIVVDKPLGERGARK